MTALVEASALLKGMAAPERGKRALLALSRKLPWSYRHIKAVWYCEDRTIVCADQMKQLRRAAKLAQEEKEATNEVAKLRAEIAFIKDRLMRMDPDFYEPTSQALGMVSGEHERKADDSQ